MASIVKLKGTFKWARVREPDPDYDNFKIDIFPDADNLKVYKDSGAQLKIREADEGVYITVRRKNNELDYRETPPKVVEAGPPEVFLLDKQSGEYKKWKDGLIGNGSTGTVVFEVFDTRNGKGSRLLRVFVDSLVEYTPQPKVSPDTTDLPF